MNGTTPPRVRIVHVTGDHPDAIDAGKTRVIETLIGLVADRFDHDVISINRQSPPWSVTAAALLGRPRLRIETPAAQGAVTAVRYLAPGRGLVHARMLTLLGDWIARRLRRDGVPALIVGHKLTIEGIAVARAAARLGIPYALCLQGNTDGRILTTRRDLAPLYRRIYHEAAMVFSFAPWAERLVADRLGARQGPTVSVPCPTPNDDLIPPNPTAGGIVSAFHLHNYRGKNAPALIAAAAHARRRDPAFALAIVGGGTADQRAAVHRLAARTPAVTLEGPLPHAEMPARLHRAAGFALPSRRETFGLVFTEALFAGTPIVYPSGTAVDGWFDGLPFAIRVDARDPRAIAAGMLRLVREEDALKAALADWQASGAAARFRRPAIARAFGDGLAAAMGEHPA